MSGPLFEICIEPGGETPALRGGGNRVELCASLLEGGLTPSVGQQRQARAAVPIPIHSMIRPRGGDFAHSAAELATMLEDVAVAKAEGMNGVVFGCLTLAGEVDEEATAALVRAARPLSVTFHRAFDMTRDPHAALEALVRCGVDRVLTSGQRPTALEGAELLRRLHAQADGRIVILGCGEITPETAARVRQETGLTEYHFAATVARPSPMQWRNPAIGMGGTALEREYTRYETDADLVRATIAAARSA